MTLIVMSQPAIIEPVDVEDFGAPDIFATGWTIAYGPEIISSTAYIERVERGTIRRQVVVRVHYPRTQWMAALNTTLIGVKDGQSH